jgi:hypothetical protein
LRASDTSDETAPVLAVGDTFKKFQNVLRTFKLAKPTNNNTWMDHKVQATHSLHQRAQQKSQKRDANKTDDNTHVQIEATTLPFESSRGKPANVPQNDSNVPMMMKSTAEKMMTIQDFIYIEPTKAEALIKSQKNIP